MRFIYETEDTIEAHIITHMLEEHGIMAQVHGEHLRMAIGHIPVLGYIKISVIDEEEDQARSLIENWKKEYAADKPDPEDEKPYPPASSYLIPPISKETMRKIGLILFAILLILMGVGAGI